MEWIILNNLTSLEELGLNDLIFQHPFEIKLYNLKKLFISNCENIAFCEEKSFNIEILELSDILLSKPKKLLMFPKLKTYFVNNAYTHSYFIESIFDKIKFSIIWILLWVKLVQLIIVHLLNI